MLYARHFRAGFDDKTRDFMAQGGPAAGIPEEVEVRAAHAAGIHVYAHHASCNRPLSQFAQFGFKQCFSV